MIESLPLDLLTLATDRWRLCESADTPTVVKLALLRDLVRSIHALKSRSLGKGNRTEAQSLKHWEAKIEDLRLAHSLEGELDQVLNREAESRKKTRIVPQALYNSLEKEKLERYDRQWELAIAAEAISSGWRLWTLEVWVEIAVVEAWEKKLADMIWPQGVLLFAEAVPAAQSADVTSSSHWHGRWYVAFHPQITAGESVVKAQNLPGSAGPGPTRWKVLFSPKSY